MSKPLRRARRPMLAGLCGLALAAAAPPQNRQAPGNPPRSAPAPEASPTTAPEPVVAPTVTSPPDPITTIAQSDKLVWTGVVLAPDGMRFVCDPRLAGTPGPQVATLAADGTQSAYPGGGWNGWNAADKRPDPAPSFVGVSAIRLAPDNALWVVDSGLPAYGKPLVPHATKLVRFDLASRNVTRVLAFDPAVLRPRSMIGTLRFNGSHAYLADEGAAGLLVVDLDDGSVRRVLDGDPSVSGQRPITVDGAVLKGPDNKPAMLNASILEVSPDGKFLYFQPVAGPLSRIPTALLDDPGARPQDVASAVVFWYDTPALGGSAIGPDGTLYLEDIENDSVLALSPERTLTTIAHDPRLHWPAEPFLRDGVLTIPVSQFDRIAAFHHGRALTQFPLPLLSLRVAAATVVHTGRP